jgi:xanthine/CO dehydrogenase XdhC/CoxF family maturation factor
VIAAAESVFLTGQCKFVSFDTRSPEDVVFGTGIGCKGKIGLFMELLPTYEITAISDFYFGGPNLDRRCAKYLVTAATGRLVNLIGRRIGEADFDVSVDSSCYESVLRWGRLCLAANKSAAKTFIIENDSLEIFADVLNPIPEIHIMGAGDDAIPVHDFAARLGWHIYLYDHRPAFATSARFPRAVCVNLCRPDGFLDHFRPSPYKYVVLMSHNYLIDQDYLRILLTFNLPFLGLLGPSARGKQMLQEIRSEGSPVRPEMLPRIHNPVGLDIGGDRPETIALAIVAQIQSILAEKLQMTSEPSQESLLFARQMKIGVSEYEFG